MARIACLMLLLLPVAAGADGRPPGYLIAPSADTPAGAFTAAQIARTYAGTRCPSDDVEGEYCIELSDVAVAAIRHDPRVRSIRRLERAEGGATPQPQPSIAGESASSAPWESGTYQYDSSGNIWAVGAYRYTYDAAGRLETATIARGTRTQAYRYDGFGNLNQITTDGTIRSIPVQAATTGCRKHRRTRAPTLSTMRREIKPARTARRRGRSMRSAAWSSGPMASATSTTPTTSGSPSRTRN